MTLSSSFDPSCSLLKSNSSFSITKPRVPNSESRSSYPSFSLFPRGRHVLAITWFEQEEDEPLDSCNLAKWVWLKRVDGDVASRIGAGQVLRLQELQSWIKVDKAGATLPFEEPNKGGAAMWEWWRVQFVLQASANLAVLRLLRTSSYKPKSPK